MKKNFLFITPDHRNIFHILHKLKISKGKKNDRKLYINNKWKLILMHDGSLTQNLNSFTGSDIYANISEKFNYLLINKKK